MSRVKDAAGKTEAKVKLKEFSVWAPTMSFQVVPPFATIAPKVKELKVRRGENFELAFEISRAKHAPDEMTVGLSLPSGQSALTAPVVILSKGENTGKLTVSAAKTAEPGPVASAALAITAQIKDSKTQALSPIKIVIEPE